MKIDWWKYISNSDHKIITDYELLEILKQIERAYNIIQLNKQEPIITTTVNRYFRLGV